MALLGYLAQVLPGVDQHNGIVIAMTLPTHFGVAGGLAMVGKRRDTP